MPRHTATEARRELFRLLDSVERGDEVILERRGVSFRLILDAETPILEVGPCPLRVRDPALLEGEWSWETDIDGQLIFAGGTQR
jgi:hypothetical protein